ncbi:MAG: hypothetical protein ABJC19_11650 [Gemmatimonadota bacterium]
MQTLVQIICTRGPSLRDGIVNDAKLAAHQLCVVEKQRSGRSKGWAKLHSTAPDRRGALNIEWDAATSILLCRIVNRGAARPHLILGDFIDYIFHRHRRRIEAVNIVPR